ncbi:amidohydrolase family protein [Niallia sp. NCCP-28]|uniref:amidohydrolase family protein n=1 Tax=Niallia sp. NCCP-28 TaxID=2934712 RepID=UPI002086FDE6|nr:amidohydrolase family protein [Niallia sp. NCCP-28]GKU85082.1 deaminase [Niallia sp. NCCP-28]
MEKLIKNVKFDKKIWDIEIKNGAIRCIVSAGSYRNNSIETFDAKGLLYLPTLSDMHCHLDKHFLGEEWKSLQPFTTLPNQLKFEKNMMSSLKNSVKTRAAVLLEKMMMQGTTKLRTHVDIDPDIGLKHLEAILLLKEELQDKIDIEIVAFPQQGLLRSSSIGIMKEAMRNGADLVGGVDPAGLDRRVEASLNAMFELSTEFKAGMDLHLHEPGHLGQYTIELLADYTQQANKQGDVAVSHAYCLGMLDKQELQGTLAALKENQISIISSVPIDRPMPPIDYLLEEGVAIQLGTDNIRDSWSPFGNGDMLQRASRLAEKCGWITDENLRKAFSLITSKSITPMIGEDADFMLVEAKSIEHAMASIPNREAVFSKGALISQEKFVSG